MPQENVFAIGAAPAKQIALLARLAAQAAPEHTELDAEFAREGRPHSGMAERIG